MNARFTFDSRAIPRRYRQQDLMESTPTSSVARSRRSATVPRLGPSPLRAHLEALADLLLYFRHFVRFQLGGLQLQGLRLAWWVVGISLLLDLASPELLYTAGLDAVRGEWVWLVALVAGLPLGWAWSRLGGMTIRWRLGWAGKPVNGPEDRKRTDALFAYTSLPGALAWVLYRFTHTLYEGFDFVTAPARTLFVYTGSFLIVCATLYGVYLTYVAVRLLYLPTLGQARRWFLLVPVLVLLVPAGYRLYRFTEGYSMAVQYFNLGVERRFDRDYPSTIRYYHTALSYLSDREAERPLALDLFENLSDLYLRTGQPQKATRALAHAVDFAREGTPELHVLKARQALLADDLHTTQQELQQALKLNPNHLDALSASARFYMGLDNGGAPDYAAALPFSRKLYTLNAAYDGARENLALNYYYLGDYQTALDLLADELQIHPRNAQAWFYTGLIYNQLDKPDTAFMYMEKAISIDPSLRTPELDSVLKRN